MGKKEVKKLGRYVYKYIVESERSRKGSDALVYQFESKHGKDEDIFDEMVKAVSKMVKKKKGWKFLWSDHFRYIFLREKEDCIVEISSWRDSGGPHGVTLSIDHDEEDARHEVRDLLNEIF